MSQAMHQGLRPSDVPGNKRSRRPAQRWPLVFAALCVAGLNACGTQGKPIQTKLNAPGVTSAATRKPTNPASKAPTFESLTDGATRQDGLLPIWHASDKVWIELRPQAFGKPFYLSPKLATGIGEAGVFGGLMQSRWARVGRPQWVEFRQVNQQVQLLAINAGFVAQHGTPSAHAVAQAFSPSLLASVPLGSSPDAATGAVLIDAGALLSATDIMGMSQHLQRSYRQNYTLDSRNSALVRATTDQQAVTLEVSQHFASPNMAVSLDKTGKPASSMPTSVPDPRSLFLTAHYTLTPLPDTLMRPRTADARVGYFVSTVADFTDDLTRTPLQHHINRWRLAKKDPQAALSEPVTPIVYWLDPSIPQAYRSAITQGVLAWNKAFEAIGFRNAIEVRAPDADTPLPPFQTGHVAIRWMTNSKPSFGAIGPTHVDPRTGEILHAMVALESLSTRAMRATRSQTLTFSAQNASPSAIEQEEDLHAFEHCQHGDLASDQLALGLQVLRSQAPLEPDSPEVQAFVLAYLKDVTMHEVGHTLGLRHNFKASRWHTQQALNDPAIGLSQGNSASVMDYTPINLPAPGEPGGTPFQHTLGPYDYWAIEYGYMPLPDEPDKARDALKNIAQRSDDPAWAEALAFGTDEDLARGLDPQALTFDLGQDPVTFVQTRLAIVKHLFEQQSRQAIRADEDPSQARRNIGYGLRELARASQILISQIGGLIVRRNGPGSGLNLLDPLPDNQQRAAMRLLTSAFLAPDALDLPAALQRRLAPDFFDRPASAHGGLPVAPSDFSWATEQLALQRSVLAALMSEARAERMLDNIDKTRDRVRHPLTPKALFSSLRRAIWSAQTLSGASLAAPSSAPRRNLQREHVNRLSAAIVRPGSNRADVRALFRDEALTLLRQLRARGQGGDDMDAAHRRDCMNTLEAALQAGWTRATP